MLSPSEIASKFAEISKKKASLPLLSMIILGFLAGAFIAFAAQCSTVVSSDVTPFGINRLVTGAIFATGLMLVILAGAELFTGNSLMVVGVLQKSISLGGLLRNWVVVYFSNFLGAVSVAYLMSASGLWRLNGGKVGASVVAIAAGKLSLSFGEALARGILCNWIVCLAVWIATGATSAAGKIAGVFFPITLFVASGFEHSIANMYYVPAGMLASTAGFGQGLTFGSFISRNLLPVTLGNIIGGTVLVAFAYWLAYLRKN